MESLILDENGYKKKIETYPNFNHEFLKLGILWDILVF